MASCLPQCNRKKFTTKEIDRFSDRIQNVLDNPDSRKLLNNYLQEVRRPDLLKVVKLWEDANLYLKLSETFDEVVIMEAIDEIDEFNTNPFLSICENNNKLLYVKQECSRILSKILKNFIKYLEQFHKQ